MPKKITPHSERMMNITLRALAFTLLAGAFASACGGCGEDNNGQDACVDVTCAAGVCDSTSGECVNADDCGGDDANCLDGFVCQDNACVEDIVCTTNSDCGDGQWCSDGSCVADPCEEVTCERGVCQVGVGECVNAETCTGATQGEACLEGNICVETECVSNDDFCADLACERGVCSTDERRCVNADNCAGDDTQCEEGYFCADDNTCQVNRCDDSGGCPQGGVCEPATGMCVNAETCTEASQCSAGFLCIGDACVAEADACGGPCEGNQSCEYDEDDLTATCTENVIEGCSNAVDCVQDRVCADGACAAPTACVADEFEENDEAAAATNIQELGEFGVIAGLSLCSADPDVFVFDTAAAAVAAGELTVRVDLAPEDVGLGTLKVELFDPAGASVASATTAEGGVPASFVEIATTIAEGAGGIYTIHVTDNGDVSTAGVRYRISAGMVAADVRTTCSAATVLSITNPTVVTIPDPSGTSLNSSCGDDDGSLFDTMATFTLAQDAYVQIQLTPSVGFDLLASLRTSCSSDGSEVPETCVDSDGSGGSELIEKVLPAGTYFLLLEPWNTNEGGDVVVTFDVTPTICTPQDNTCSDPTNASVCNETGTGFDMVSCPDGCDANTGACLLPAGDVCADAIPVPATGFEGTINMTRMGMDYDPGDTCVPQDGYYSRTDGEDAVFVATVPAGQVLIMEAVSIESDDLSLYLSTDCTNPGAACLAGTDEFGYTRANSETVSYRNDTGTDQTVYAYVDLGEIDFTVGMASVSIEFAPSVCEPNSRRCVLNRESQLCNSSGTGYDSTTICETGCDATTGACTSSSDVCSGAALLTSGITSNGTLVGAVDDYEPGESTCGTITSGDSGNDAGDIVYRVVTTDPAQTVTVVLNAADFDAQLWLSDSCSGDVLGTCLDGADEDESDGDPETLRFFAENPGTYFITVQDGDSELSVGAFDITATVEPAVCTPGELLGCDMNAINREICGEDGTVETFTCAGGCDVNTGKCAAPAGDVCLDVIELSPAGGTYSGTLDNNGTDVVDFAGAVDRCTTAPSGPGDEIFHAVNLTAGDFLEVKILDKSSDQNAELYLQQDCGSENSCIGFVQDGSSTVTYFAEQSETIFVVVDSDSSSTFSGVFDYDLTWTVTQPGWVCEPNTVSCNGDNIQECSTDGFSFTSTFCPTGCASGRCADAPALTDVCTTAPNVGSGISVRVDLEDDHTATLNPDGALCDLDAGGPDAFFAVNAQVYDLITVKATGEDSLDDIAVYIISDCADAAGSCLAGVDQDDVQLLQKQVLQAGTYIVGIDYDPDTIWGDYMDVEISVEPGCVPSAPPVCNAGGTAVEFCVEGIVEEYLCTGGCANAACNVPRGDACFDAIPLDRAATSVAGNWTGNVNTIEVDQNLVGSCLIEDVTDGVDDIYSVTLAAGETLTARLESSLDDSYGVLYLVGDCADPSATCLANNPTRDFTQPFSYRATVAETVFLIVDRSDSNDDESYTLHYEIDGTLICTPAQSSCSDANTRVDCNEDGTVATPTACAYGCVAGGCAPGLEADTCATAVDIGDGGVFLGNYGDFTDTLDFGGLCAGEAGDGSEMFFSATLAAGDILRVDVQAIDFDDPMVYFLSDCSGDISACLGGVNEGSLGQRGTSYDSVSTEYVAGVDETIIVVVDSYYSSADEPVLIEFDVLTPNCDPATHQQVCTVDGNAFEYCDDRGFLQQYACAGVATCEATTGRCTEPVGDVCRDPFDANPTATATPRTISGTFTGFVNDYDLGTGNQCTGSRTLGNEPVYVVDLLAGQTLTASVVSTETTPEDVALYVTDDCSDVAEQCLAGADAEAGTTTPEQLTYTATTDETIYLMVDSFYATAAGAFDLTVTVN